MMRRLNWFSQKLVSFLIGVCLVVAINTIERVFFPVVRDFTVTSVTYEGHNVIMSGYMRKNRDCQFAGVTASDDLEDGTSIDLPLKFRDNNKGDSASRVTGRQQWGPWSVEVPITIYVDQIDLNSVHKCHPFWATTTHLASVPIVKGYKND